MYTHTARLAQSVERTAFNRMVVGSSPTVGIFRYGLVVRISRFHREGRGSIPRIGILNNVTNSIQFPFLGRGGGSNPSCGIYRIGLVVRIRIKM